MVKLMIRFKFGPKGKAIILIITFIIITTLLFKFSFIRSKYISNEILEMFYNSLPPKIFRCVFSSLVITLGYLLTRFVGNKILSDTLNPNETKYIRNSINWIYIACFFGGAKEFKLKNMPIWISFKIILTWPRLEGIVDSLETDNSKILCKMVNTGNNNDEVNIIVDDTYETLSKIDPSDFVSRETWYLKKIKSNNYSGSYKSYNARCISDFSSKIGELSKCYTTVNLFLSTSPYMTKKIIDTCFEMDRRDGFKHLCVYESSSEHNFKFVKKHKIF